MTLIKRLWGKLAFLALNHNRPADFTSEELELWRTVKPHTLTGIERIITLARAVQYVEKSDIPGDYVECGVYRGGSLLTMALGGSSRSSARRIYGFDTFDGGTTLPTEADGRENMIDSKRHLAGVSADRVKGCSVASVQATVLSSGISPANLSLVQGLVENTIPQAAPKTIAILRLDTDYHDSTLHTLTHLYPRLSRGGVLIIDDYGHFEGCRRAVDRYLEENQLKLMLARVDYCCRMAVKL